MLKNSKIGFIGAGNMARALVSGLLRGKHVDKSKLGASDRQVDKIEAFVKDFDIYTTQDNQELATWADIIVLSTKPQVFGKVLKDISSKTTSDKLIISIAAGVPISHIDELLPKNSRIVRVMPNVNARVDLAATALCGGEHAKQEDVSAASALFKAVGTTVIVDEDQMDAVTGLSGSGPAYIFLMIDSLADAGVKVGLAREVALQLAAQTVLGSAKLLIESGEHPGRLKDMVTSPGGTAIAGIHTLEQGGLRTTLINAVEKATARSKELGASNGKKK